MVVEVVVQVIMEVVADKLEEMADKITNMADGIFLQGVFLVPPKVIHDLKIERNISGSIFLP